MTDPRNTVVAILEHPLQANAAVNDLHRAGIGVERLSIVGKDHHTREEPADSDKLLVLSHDAPDEVRRAQAILEGTPAERTHAPMGVAR